MASREAVFQALFDRVENVSWTPGEDPVTFVTKSRRVKLFSDVPSDQQPALFQAEHDETSAQRSNMPYKRVWSAQWIIYHNSSDPQDIPAVTNNLIMEAVESALAPLPSDPGFPDQRNTLGGLVHHCFIDGTIFKDPGDIDEQAMIVVPIKLLVP